MYLQYRFRFSAQKYFQFLQVAEFSPKVCSAVPSGFIFLPLEQAHEAVQVGIDGGR
jgi:hypothetical protein